MQIKKLVSYAAVLSVPLLLMACDADDGRDGVDGMDGMDGMDGLSSLISQTDLMPGDANCFAGGVQIDSGLDDDGDGVLAAGEVDDTAYVCAPTTINESENFNRIATFPVCSQLDVNCDVDTETAAEIVAASADGNTLIYSDSPLEAIGFIDITNPTSPVADGTLAMPGEPTSVAVTGGFALIGINSSADFINVAGSIEVVDIATKAIVRSIDIGGQPDSVAVSSDGAYAAVVLENERDEEICIGGTEDGNVADDDATEEACETGGGEVGVLPQLPAGALVILNTQGVPADWTTSTVALTGLADLAPEDPEPEYIDINDDNIAVISMQENNHLVLVDLTDGSIVNDFSAGAVDLTQVDLTEEGALINMNESEAGVLREPDGVSWISTEYFATANEGDLDGGSRGFSIFNTDGEVVFESGNSLDHITASVGHYPDERSGNKGNEPENAEFGVYGDERYLFVNSERSSLVFVYDVADLTNPVFKQILPTAAGPEGALAIPSRNLLVVASEEDNRGDKLRSGVNIYSYGGAPQSYPTLESLDRLDGTPIPFGALSGLAADPVQDMLYSIEDSFYLSNRIFGIDISNSPAKLVEEIRIVDTNDVFAAYPAVALADASVDDDDATRIGVFDEADLDAMINDDKTVNIDPEGISVASDGGFWVASEGSGTIGDANRPINSLNFIFKTDASGVIENVIDLPPAVNANQLRFGFEGVAEYDGKAYVAFQRVWAGDTNVRIGVYDVVGDSWIFLFYPLDAVESQDGGWVGLSDITSLGGGEFLVLERDNKGGPDAAVKRLYHIDVSGLVDNDVVTKTLVRDILPDLTAPGGFPYEKVEGSAVDADGNVWIVNDNDGVDDNSGEIQLINLGPIIP